MLKNVKSLLYKSKMSKCFFTMLLACFIMTICNAQPPQKNNVHEFTSATWNTNGPRWNVVQALMNYGLDILAIQEAGNIGDISSQLSSPAGNRLQICFGGFDLEPNSDVGVQEYIWNTGSGTFYMYYYNNRLDTPSAPGTSQGTTKQNMAIISRQRAGEIVLIPSEVRHTPIDAASENYQSRTFINRPVLGIRIANSVFFNIHPEPNRTRNEAPELINVIQNYMETYYPDQTWMVMGDFNRTPAQLRSDLPSANNGRFIDIMNSGQNTRSSGELDYSIVGGPAIHRTAIIAIVAQLLQMQVPNPSDHKPVRFN